MADAAVEFLLENLKQVWIHHKQLVNNAPTEMKQLEKDVMFFKLFLKQIPSKKRRKNDKLKMVVRDIRNVIYDADDIIDAMVIQASENKTKNYFSKTANKATDLIALAKNISIICTEIREICGVKDKFDLINFSIDDGEDDEEPLKPPSRKDHVVGLEDEAETIVGYLNGKTDYMDVISIIGMPGLGKTTLTGEIFHDPNIIREFPIRVWIYISQEFKEKDVFLSILRKLKTQLIEDEYGKKSAAELAKEIAAILHGEKFLLVMDDVWETGHWDKLKVVLPKHNTKGKVMITSRHEKVGLHTNHVRKPHQLRPLNLDESVELLQWEVFDKPEFPPELVTVGKDIAHKCDGLPLAIVVIGGVLATKFSRSSTGWDQVSKSVTTFIHEDPLKHMDRLIAMSYEALPYHLKECFLYLGMFPENYEIPAWKLIRMWIAEGLIQPKDGISMEENAEYNYMDELISRNLVKVRERKADGRVKICLIHDMLRDFCKREGGKEGENFLQEIKLSRDGGLQPLVTEGQMHRRLCIHSNVLDFLSKKPMGTSVRSFVTFSQDIEMLGPYISAIFAAFKVLRVLEARSLRFSKLPSDFYHLVQLRYLALSLRTESTSKPAILPAAFKKLWNIQTLIVDTTSLAIDIKVDILSMTQLRHLKTNVSTTLPKSENSEEGDKLQTLCTMSPESCTEAIFERAHNLKKLGIRGKIALFLDGKIGSVDSLIKLTQLEKLKLVNDVFPNTALSGKLERLPPHHIFPTTLTSLTLAATRLDWTHMSVLASLKKLKVLKLKDDAFVGANWVVGDGGFDSLEVLFIGRTTLSIWEASAHHFCCLKRLELRNCEQLKQVPVALADIPSFEYLDLHYCEDAVASAMEIAAKKKPTLKLSIVSSVVKNNA